MKRGRSEKGSSSTSCQRRGFGLSSLDWARSGLGWRPLADLGHLSLAHARPFTWVPAWFTLFVGAAASRMREGKREEKEREKERERKEEKEKERGEKRDPREEEK